MVAIDAMGGDYAPHALILGSLAAAQQNIPLILFGPQKNLEIILQQADPEWRRYPITLCDAQDTIAMDEDPVFAIKNKQNSSLVQAVKSVQDGRCGSVLSAGNSGALLAASLMMLGRSGASRPAIVGFIPTKKWSVIGLDLGANADCRAQHLVEFAHMGHEYATQTLRWSNPRVALLCNGHENNKGSRLIKETFSLLTQFSTLNFVGNIEPEGVFNNDADIIVMDGFSGNILLKTMEAIYSVFVRRLTQSCMQSENIDIQTWGKNFLDDMSKSVDSKKKGGALLLGVNGRVIVCHGNSDAATIVQAIKMAANM
ncbi:MAG: phosphate acyltransferase PlsX [bacterium]